MHRRRRPRRGGPRAEVLRLCLDVNVWVSYYLALARGHGLDTAAGGLAGAAFDGVCCLGPVQPVVSHAMLDTLEHVLRRNPVTAPVAEMARDQVEASAGNGCLAEPASIVLGGTAAIPLIDSEDAAVLNTALAGRAHLLVTHNMGDFIRGPRGRTATTTLAEQDGKPAAVRLDHPKVGAGLVVASPFSAAAWIIRGEPAPIGTPDGWPGRRKR